VDNKATPEWKDRCCSANYLTLVILFSTEKTVIVSKLTASDFFMRYLANKNGLAISMRKDLQIPPSLDKLNLGVFD
jgi:hypothetical protein